MRELAEVVIVIVGYHNPHDIKLCLVALSQMEPQPNFEVVIAENGGLAAALQLNLELSQLPFYLFPCRAGADSPLFCEWQTTFGLTRHAAGTMLVHVAPMAENLGYAGAINVCLTAIQGWPSWKAIWILNPDTQPLPGALSALERHSLLHHRGMIGSRLSNTNAQEGSRMCGLRWSKSRAQAKCVSLAECADPDAIGRLDAPSGASMYVTRPLIAVLGAIEEQYFLYFEDLDWGLRAKCLGSIGYAHDSLVQHRGGSTIGSARSRAGASPLATYLEYRNRILFVSKFYPGWLAWTVAMQVVHGVLLLLSGGWRNILAAVSGVMAGVSGKTGRPDQWLARHHVGEIIGARGGQV